MKSVQIRSFIWSIFSRIWIEYGEIRTISLYSVRENTDQKKLCIWTLFTQCYLSVFSLNAGKYRPEKTPSLDTFHALSALINGHPNAFFFFLSIRVNYVRVNFVFVKRCITYYSCINSFIMEAPVI